MRQRECILESFRRRARAAPRRCSIWRSAIAKPFSPCTRTRSARSPPRWRITCLPWWNNSSATPRACIGAYQRTNRNPLGACAITGTGFPHRSPAHRRSAGLRRTHRQHLRQHRDRGLSARKRVRRRGAAGGAGRFVQDLLLWSTSEFNYLRLGDGFVQSSSIMPQKRNPVALEHARAIGSKALGQAQAIVIERPQYAVRRYRRYRRRSAAAGLCHVPRCHARCGTGGRRHDVLPSSTPRAWKRARAMAGPRSPNWPIRSRATAACRSARRTRFARAWSRCANPMHKRSSPICLRAPHKRSPAPLALFRNGTRRDSQPAPFH